MLFREQDWSNYSYIGSFQVESGSFDIADPFFNPMARSIYRLPISNGKSVSLHDVLNGTYHAYRIYDVAEGYPTHIVVVHDAFGLSDIQKDPYPDFCGYSCTAGSEAVVLVDRMYRYNTRYSYYSMLGGEDEFYDGVLIRENLSEMPYSEEKKKILLELVNEKLKTNNHPTGREIMDIVGEDPIWEGFRDFNNCSTHWSNECLFRLMESSMRDVIIKGGVVSSAPGGFVPCWKFSTSRGPVYAVVIKLDEVLQLGVDVSEHEKRMRNRSVSPTEDASLSPQNNIIIPFRHEKERV